MDVLEAPAITPETVAEHGLSDAEYQRILNALGREGWEAVSMVSSCV